MPTHSEPTPVLIGRRQDLHKRFSIVAASNGYIVETYIDCQEQRFVFTDLGSAFEFIRTNF